MIIIGGRLINLKMKNNKNIHIIDIIRYKEIEALIKMSFNMFLSKKKLIY